MIVDLVQGQEKAGVPFQAKSFLLLLFVVFRASADWVGPHSSLGGSSPLLSLPIQMLIAPENTFIDRSRNNVSSGHSVASQVDT